MKKLFSVVFLAIVLTGCSTLNTASEIADIFISDKPVYTDEIQSVMKSKDGTTIIFVGGNGYEIANNPYLNPGDTASVFKEADGSYRAEKD